MPPISDHVFDQHDSDERAARLKRLLVGGAAFTAAGGAVAGAAVLKGDDDLSFPDEADDGAIDKAIKDTEDTAGARADDPVAAAAPQTLAAAPQADFEPALRPAAEEGERVVGEVVEERPLEPNKKDADEAAPPPQDPLPPAPDPGATAAAPGATAPATPGGAPGGPTAAGGPGRRAAHRRGHRPDHVGR